jgi:Plant ATP synthase F0
MPQFDLSSFIVQIFWLFFLFMFLYFLYVYKFLPSHLFLVKLRKRLNWSKPKTSSPVVIKDVNQLKSDK